VLGICNGFQVLCEAGLLPGALTRNTSLRFRSHEVHIRVENPRTIFTSQYEKGQMLRFPIAHGEGNFQADDTTLAELEGEGRIVFRYSSPLGDLTPEANPNGSAHHIAGIINERGNVLGMMPHPERAMEDLLGSRDGRGVFESLAEALSAPTAGAVQE
jgi:phosphoribosylformylglycinamidine synthase subunit PurQ / glutaminase